VGEEPHETTAEISIGVIQAFRIRGHVDDVPMVAVWTTEDGLVCPPALHQRAQVIVAMEDTFEPGHATPRRTAALDGPDASVILLTVVRAFSAVTSVIVHR
jgi:hypothetical protein